MDPTTTWEELWHSFLTDDLTGVHLRAAELSAQLKAGAALPPRLSEPRVITSLLLMIGLLTRSPQHKDPLLDQWEQEMLHAYREGIRSGVTPTVCRSSD